jgi:putative flippase GtrA
MMTAISNRSLRSFAIFLAVGSSSAAVYVVLNVAFPRLLGLPPAFAIALTLAMLMPPTYLAQRSFAFSSSNPHFHAFPRYVGTQLVGNVLAMIGSEVFSQSVKAAPWIAFTAIAGCVAVISYALMRFWTFRPTREVGMDARA